MMILCIIRRVISTSCCYNRCLIFCASNSLLLSLSLLLFISPGKHRTPTIDEDDDSDSSSDEEPWAAPVVQRGQGKQLRPPPAPTAE